MRQRIRHPLLPEAFWVAPIPTADPALGTSRMNWAWLPSLDEVWRSPAFPMWLTLAAAGFFALILLVTLLRAERSVANGALTVITLLAIGIAVAATLRGFAPDEAGASRKPLAVGPATAALPALACVD